VAALVVGPRAQRAPDKRQDITLTFPICKYIWEAFSSNAVVRRISGYVFRAKTPGESQDNGPGLPYL
jgi:hypothetical protein